MDDALDDLQRRLFFADVEDDVRHFVEAQPGVVELMRGDVVAEHRPLGRLVADAIAKYGVRRGKKNRHALRLNELDVLLERERAAASGDHRLFEIVRGAEDVALALAEI